MPRKPQPRPKTVRQPSSCGRYSALISFISSLILVAGLYLAKRSYYDGEPEERGDSWKVVEMPGRGKGMIATRDIPQGDLILREKSLFLVPPSVTGPEGIIRTLVDGLSPDDRRLFEALSYHSEPDATAERLPLAKFQTNAISAGGKVGLFPRTARMNHGCSSAFNAMYTWREDEQVLVVHALKPIKEGQELITVYTDTKRPRDERRAYLSSMYNFFCECSVCALPSNESIASDERLTRMQNLKNKFATWGADAIDGKEATSLVNEIWGVGETEGYWSERGQLAADAAHVSAAHSDDYATRAWASLSHKWFSIELGEDSEQAMKMKSILRNPQAYVAWGTKATMDVELPHGP